MTQTPPEPGPAGGSLRTALVALASNLVVAAARLVAGLLTGSATLLAEAAHAGADSINQLLLVVSIGSARRAPSERHPFGYQGQRFLWAFVAAMGTLVVGGLVSVWLGIRELLEPGGEVASPVVGFAVIAVAFVADGISLVRGLRQARALAAAQGTSTVRLVLQTNDPIVRAVVVEDVISLVGDVVATFGLGLRVLTGSSVPDAVGALVVGVVLAVAAVLLARILGDFLIGRGLPADDVGRVRDVLRSEDAVTGVLSVSAIYVGPAAAVVTAHLVVAPGLDSVELARRLSDLDRRVREAVPVVVDVYLDPTYAEVAPGVDLAEDAVVSPVLRLPDAGD